MGIVSGSACYILNALKKSPCQVGQFQEQPAQGTVRLFANIRRHLSAVLADLPSFLNHKGREFEDLKAEIQMFDQLNEISNTVFKLDFFGNSRKVILS